MFGSIGMPELIIIFVIALIIFGPRKLPELGRSLGKSIGEFKRASNDLRSTLEEEIKVEESRAPETTATESAASSPIGKAASTATVTPPADATSAEEPITLPTTETTPPASATAAEEPRMSPAAETTPPNESPSNSGA